MRSESVTVDDVAKDLQERPAQTQHPPGEQSKMEPEPLTEEYHYHPAGKLRGKAALITGADSGIGRAVAVMFAKEGADIAFCYLKEHADAQETIRLVERQGRKCLAMPGDAGIESFCETLVEQAHKAFGRLDILVNNAAEQHPQQNIEDITYDQLERTFRTNIFSYFFMTKAALKFFKPGATIINTTSVTAYRGSAHLLDYSSTKGAIVSFTRSLSLALIEKGIRVNGVAPGPIWTPLIPSTFPQEKVQHFGEDTPMKRAGQPAEVAPCFVFLASSDSSYMSGQILHPNGGEVLNT